MLKPQPLQSSLEVPKQFSNPQPLQSSLEVPKPHSQLSEFISIQTERNQRSKSHSGLYLRTGSEEEKGLDSDEGNGKRNVFSLERKVDLLFKKYKLMEDKLKRSEKEATQLRQVTSDLQAHLEKQSEAQKGDKRLLHSAKEQIAALRSRIDALSSSQSATTAVSAPLQALPPLMVPILVFID